MADKTNDERNMEDIHITPGTNKGTHGKNDVNENTSTDDISTEEGSHVDDVLGAGAQALQHSALMFGDPLRSSDTGGEVRQESDEKRSEIPESHEERSESHEERSEIPEDEGNHIDLVMGAGAEALHASARMFGDPLKTSAESSADAEKQAGSQDEHSANVPKDHVDVVLGAGAHALQASALMFGDPLKSSTRGDGQDEEDEGQNDDEEGFVREDEVDVTRHDDFFDIDVRIRLIEESDEKAVRALIYDGIYVAALNRYILNATERPFVVCAVGLFAVLFSWLFGGIILAIFLSVVILPLAVYIYARYVALAMHRRRYLPDVQTGIYNHWTATNAGRVMWVAEIEGKVVATVAVETHSGIVAEMKHLSVAPEWQCLGIGGRLAQHALSHMRRRRFKKVIAQILSIHNEAINMYNKLGFRRTNVRTVWAGLCTLEDFDMNLSTGSLAQLAQEE